MHQSYSWSTQQHLLRLDRSKCKLQSQPGARIKSPVYVVEGHRQPLLGKEDDKRLGIMTLDLQGGDHPMATLARLEKVVKDSQPQNGVVSGNQTQPEIDLDIKKISAKKPKLFKGLGSSKG